jgi:hypothetical protein
MGCASKNAGQAAGGASSAAAAAATAGNLYTSLGGSAGVQALANSFGAKLALNSTVTKFLDAAAIDAAKGGLTNSIMALSGMALPSGATDLAGALMGKGLDVAGMAGVTQSLMDAGKELSLKPEQVAGLSSLMQSVGASVLSGK